MPPCVFLRPLDLDRDISALHEIFGDEESCRFLPCPARKSVDETHALLSGWIKGCEETEWALAQTPNGPCLGRIAMIARGDETFEAACMVSKSFTLIESGKTIALKVITCP